MLTIIYWLFSKIGELTSFALSFHILGNLSLLHFIIGFGLLSWIISFLTFGNYNIDTTLRIGNILNNKFTNAENKNDKLNYYDYATSNTYSYKHNGAYHTNTISYRYKVNRKTGKTEEVGLSHNYSSRSEL